MTPSRARVTRTGRRPAAPARISDPPAVTRAISCKYQPSEASILTMIRGCIDLMRVLWHLVRVVRAEHPGRQAGAASEHRCLLTGFPKCSEIDQTKAINCNQRKKSTWDLSPVGVPANVIWTRWTGDPESLFVDLKCYSLTSAVFL